MFFLLGYFTRLRKIVDIKIPPLVEPTTRPPTPLAGCLLDFIIQPLEFAAITNSENHRFVFCRIPSRLNCEYSILFVLQQYYCGIVQSTIS